jgi:cholesterol oxidase
LVMVVAHFDAVVVGSGFGGSVTAFRLAEAGLSVCLLERGKAYPPGSFPRTPREMGRNFWGPDTGYYGLFDIRAFRRKLWCLVSSGLGGGSLIDANTLLRKDEKWFVREDENQPGYEYWPVTRDELDPHYERMLSAQRYPFETHVPYSATPKTRQLKYAAEQLGLDWQPLNLAVTFANDGCEPEIGMPIAGPENLHGVPRFTCRLCGECNLGCNFGSKNTLDLNYLTRAWQCGAEIRTLCEVQEIGMRANGGYFVRYVEHQDAASAEEPAGLGVAPLVEISADQLVLAAGTLGTNELLLRNGHQFPRISPRLGQRFSGNGNLLTFAFNARESCEGKDRPRRLDPSRGPVITSAIRVPDAVDGGDGDGFYIEDAGFPLFLEWALELTRPNMVTRFAGFAARRLWSLLSNDPVSDLSRELASAIGPGTLSSSSLPLAGMGRDRANGVISLRKGHLDIDWDGSRDSVTRLHETAQAIARVWQADFQATPIKTLGRAITVHPLGGCAMGRYDGEGVVDSYGQVFHYPGLYIVDGSVMPGSVGPNPALTIAALADRFADRIIETANRRSERKHSFVPELAHS